MKYLPIVKTLSIVTLVVLTHCAWAAFVVSDTLIANNLEARIQCRETCATILASWTGRWWTTADPFSVCECFHDCPDGTVYPRNYACRTWFLDP